jgi:RecA/RadA recombinase
MNDTDDLKDALRTKKKTKGVLSNRKLLSTGSTILNLACTGRTNGGFLKGTMVHLVGDSGTGKTWLALSVLAEASINPNFADYRFIHDNPENGALMDVAKFFGKGVRERLEPCSGSRSDPVYSTVVEEFFDYVEDAQKANIPFIYILDSMDALSSNDEGGQIEKERTAREGGKDSSGSYGTSRAKAISARLRRVVGKLRETGSILIILSQTRQNIGFSATFKPKTYAGGLAMKFYATLQIWTSSRGDIVKTVRKKKRQLGIYAKMKIEKNRITGRERDVIVPIYHSIGIDDIGSCIDFLVEEGHWKESKGTVRAPEFDFTGTCEQLVRRIEEEDDELQLRALVGRVWGEIEAACVVKRKSRYE